MVKRYNPSDPTYRAAMTGNYKDEEIKIEAYEGQREQVRRLAMRDALKSGLTVKKVKADGRKAYLDTGLQLAMMGGAFSEIADWWPRRGRYMISREEAIETDQYPWWSHPDGVPFGSLPGEVDRVRADIGRVGFQEINQSYPPISERFDRGGRHQ